MPILFAKYCIASLLIVVLRTSIYTFILSGADNTQIMFQAYEGKHMLIVNISTGSGQADQLASLKQLKQMVGDSLVIVLVPSNSFGTETRDNSQILNYLADQQIDNLIVASKADVDGQHICPLYYWLTRQDQNGVFSSKVKGDYQKYLINPVGELVAIFGPEVSPISQELLLSLTTTNN